MMIAADATNTSDWAATVTAAVALGLSILAFGVSIWSAVSGHRSAKAAEKAADIAEKSMAVSAQSAKAAEVSARASEKSADADGLVARVELERDHRELAPLVGEARLEAKYNAGSDRDDIFFTFTPDRTYRLYADLVSVRGAVESRAWASAPLVVECGVEVSFFVAEATSVSKPNRLEMRFFPPVDGDPGGAWSCGCGRTLSATYHDDPGHWLVTRELAFP